MVALVLVSHSHAMAVAAKELVLAMADAKLPIAIAAGAGDNHAELGTNAVEIMEAIQGVMSDEGVLVIMDMGSALLSADTALGFLDDAQRARVRCAAAPFVEGAVAAGVSASLGNSLEEVELEASQALRHKTEHLGTGEATEAVEAKAPSANRIRLALPNLHGLHARPAARFIREAAAFDAEIEVRNVTKNRGPISAKSLTGLVSLEVLRGHEIEITAHGPDASAALRALQQSVASGLGDSLPDPAPAAAAATAIGVPIAVSPGLAVGSLVFAANTEISVPEDLTDDPAREVQRLQHAISETQAALVQEQIALGRSLGRNEAEIFEAEGLVLEDPTLLRAAETGIRERRENAAFAWSCAYRAVAEGYARLEDEYLRQRAADVRDIGARVLAALGVARPRVGDLADPGILVADDLAPAEVTALPGTVLGVICLEGSKTSHAAILLRARGIPAIARARIALEKANVAARSGEVTGAFDGETGELWIDPDSARIEMLQARMKVQRLANETAAQHRHETAVTADGQTVAILANLGHAHEADAAVEHGAEGVGLFRTEFLFLNRTTAPNEEEQFATLREVRETMGRRPVTIRTLDIGGDKEAPYLGLPREANPFLGERGIRLCLRRPELFAVQLRAILRAAFGGDFRLMFPMITELSELRAARAAVEGAHQELERAGVAHAWPIPIGVMIEVPSAAALGDQLAAEADFFSIGTNDLTQYVLAADRGSSSLSHFQDALHPAVLRTIAQVVTAAHAHGRPVSVCGEAASDAFAAQILLGLGVDELSLHPKRIPAIKAAIRGVNKAEAQDLATRALRMISPEEVRALANAL